MVTDAERAQVEAVLRALLADRGLALRETAIAEDATWSPDESIIVWLRGERQAIVDPVVPGDLDNLDRLRLLADRVLGCVERRRALRAAVPSLAQAYGQA